MTMTYRPTITDEIHGDDFHSMLNAIARWKAAAKGERESGVGNLAEAIAVIDAHFRNSSLMSPASIESHTVFIDEAQYITPEMIETIEGRTRREDWQMIEFSKTDRDPEA